jgi:Putative prokaryotic signal transducing protein
MAELVRTNDPGVISAIEGLLGGADIPYQVTDRNMSVLEGSIIAIQMRILVPDDHEAEARELLVEPSSATGCAPRSRRRRQTPGYARRVTPPRAGDCPRQGFGAIAAEGHHARASNQPAADPS